MEDERHRPGGQVRQSRGGTRSTERSDAFRHGFGCAVRRARPASPMTRRYGLRLGPGDAPRNRRSRRSPGGFRWIGVGRRRQCEQPLRGALVVGRAEAGAAAAATHGVRVVDREAGAHERVDVVDLRALEEADALAVHVDLDAVDVEELVLRRRCVLEHHPVAVAGAAAGVDVDAQPDVRVRLFLGQFAQLQGRSIGERNDRGLLIDHGSSVLLRTGLACS